MSARTTSLEQDTRFAVPLFTSAEVATYLVRPESTIWNWLGMEKAAAVITRVSDVGHPRDTSVPLIGLAEAFVLSVVRATGLPVQ